MLDFLSYSFMQNALLAGMAVSIVAPLLGMFLVVRRQALIADTLAHASLAGVAIGVALGIEPLLAAAIASVFAALLVERLRKAGNLSGDSTLALVLSGSLAFAVVIMSATKNFNSGVLGYLFGGITTVSAWDVVLIAIISAAVIILIIALFEKFFLLSFDEEIAAAQGLNVVLLNFLLAVGTAGVVAVGMRVVGVLLIGALMSIPVLAATQFGKGFKVTAGIAVVISFVSVIGGLITSYYFDLAAGGTIVLFTLAAFSLSLFWRALRA